ncbi:MAG: hypothetical protein RMJ03_05160 [Nitrososphaerota archaeon]|nr:hypothetical protein [Nitrososphaerota archaeon]
MKAFMALALLLGYLPLHPRTCGEQYITVLIPLLALKAKWMET